MAIDRVCARNAHHGKINISEHRRVEPQQSSEFEQCTRIHLHAIKLCENDRLFWTIVCMHKCTYTSGDITKASWASACIFFFASFVSSLFRTGFHMADLNELYIVERRIQYARQYSPFTVRADESTKIWCDYWKYSEYRTKCWMKFFDSHISAHNEFQGTRCANTTNTAAFVIRI